MIATITLNPSIDQHINVEGLRKDDANRAQAIFRYPGGKGINVSKVVRELGGKTHAYALVGGFPGELLKQLVRRLDIPFSPTLVRQDTRINVIITDLKDHTQTRISAPGPRVSEPDLRHFLGQLLRVRPKPFIWALGGSISSGMNHSAYQRLIAELQKNGVPCILDTDNEALKLGIKARPFMIKPNEYEIERLMGHSIKTVPGYFKAARSLVRQGVRIVVVSLGKKGALFVTENDSFHVLTPDVPVTSKVGAGDSLIGGFALGLYRKMGLREAARLGIAASTSAVMREAPRLCSRRDIPRLLPRIRLRSL